MSGIKGSQSNLSSSSALSSSMHHGTSLTGGGSSLEHLSCDESNTSARSVRHAKRCHFFRNADVYFKGVSLVFPTERYRSFESVFSEVTRSLSKHVNLPTGVRNLYSLTGKKIMSLDDLEDGKSYVAAGSGEPFKRLNYVGVRRGAHKTKTKSFQANESLPVKQHFPSYIYPRVITVVRNGTRPRKIVRLLINKRNAPSFDHTITVITEAVRLDTGPVLKVYAADGSQVTSHEDFFKTEDLFFAYGLERPSKRDFELDYEERKCTESIRRYSRRANIHLKNEHERSSRSMGHVCEMPNPIRQPLIKSKKRKQPLSHNTESGPVYPPLIESTYEMGPIIGEGNFAIVMQCRERATGQVYALKVIDKSKCAGREHIIDNEVAVLHKLYHPNIIHLVTEFFTDSFLYLIMEYVEGGDLFDCITAQRKFSEKEASFLLKDLASALHYIHSMNIVHRDIKPENLLVATNPRGEKVLKLGDFGLACHVSGPLYTVCGTPTYVAPEILEEKGYGLQIDVWAAGVILYILLCGYPPFASPTGDQEELFDRILSGNYEFSSPYWDDVSELAKDLISHMLQIQPEVRFSAEDVLDHHWIRVAQLDECVEELQLDDGVAGAVSRVFGECQDKQLQAMTIITY
ncbi:serine/threonine-protein kinase GL21140 isoform X1 [Schistocerca gregaria]|uniref:serine/threonine-protein kinase GL21140 isoform X1 n=2 Tax=Schistocerca gregaria TaxID=7010 RepID=UPI00211DE305|nr:serine/threonine-protein kinase GL21140 isoform X1 [Schistocerca gregaria]XP_049846436.1 serine/threonine-protein kinase GL21140 isoform X1 [Schistocerca gregaria]